MVPLIESRINSYRERQQDIERASWSTQQDSSTDSIQLAKNRSGRCFISSKSTVQGFAGLFSVFITFSQELEDIGTTISQQRSAVGIISTVTPPQWKNLLGDASLLTRLEVAGGFL